MPMAGSDSGCFLVIPLALYFDLEADFGPSDGSSVHMSNPGVLLRASK